ncbi:MAG: OB-fold domain-containing protein [Steroidobacteraceae bacterium]|jgi:uncharacterized OB-fold protein/acyl dehydratase|nr:OB-fold domain-containing protein [Steroidobacteraceae bacterium]
MTATEDTAFLETLRSYVGRTGAPQTARDPVNSATIRNWCDAMRFDGEALETAAPDDKGRAPPAMLAVWTMPGAIPREFDPDCPRGKVFMLLQQAGFASMIGVNTEEEYFRPLEIGELLTGTLSLLDVSEQKSTALGVGYFVTTLTEFKNQKGERVGTWKFRTFNFKPRQPTEEELAKKKQRQEQQARIPKHLLVRPRPAMMKETAFFWEGAQAGELRIQQCRGCQRLAHPPVVRCPACGSYDLGYRVASGKATLYSFVEPVHPPMPFMRYPYVVGVVELEEGTRLITNIVHCAPELVRIGMPLELVFQQTDPELKLPMFRPAAPPVNRQTRRFEEVQTGEELPLRPIDVTTRRIVAGAIATRDFEDIHHEAAAARRAGLPDLFMNILTTNGLCTRYVQAWAGPQASVTGINIRLGAPNVAGDTMTLSGVVESRTSLEDRGQVVVRLRGRNDLGDHVTGTVTVELPLGGRS